MKNILTRTFKISNLLFFASFLEFLIVSQVIYSFYDYYFEFPYILLLRIKLPPKTKYTKFICVL